MTDESSDSAHSGKQASDCPCFDPPFSYRDFDSKLIGVDETHGRFGDVSVERCKHCGTKWLRYHVEYEGFPRSGRWFRGLVTDDQLAEITPENAVEFLDGLPWHFYGGSYFASGPGRSSPPVSVDL